MVLNEKISALAAKYTADLVAFCQKAVQTRSYSNQEGDMVTLAGSKCGNWALMKYLSTQRVMW